jgi:hypothetical protein
MFIVLTKYVSNAEFSDIASISGEDFTTRPQKDLATFTFEDNFKFQTIPNISALQNHVTKKIKRENLEPRVFGIHSSDSLPMQRVYSELAAKHLNRK